MIAKKTSNKEYPKIPILISKCISKIYKPIAYDKAINNLIYKWY